MNIPEEGWYMFPSLKIDPTQPMRDVDVSMHRLIGDGWMELVAQLIKDIAEIDKEKMVSVTQIKEKFGGLRFYIDGGTEEIWKLIEEAEKKSYNLCDMCGAEGKLRTDLGWCRTLCDFHYEEKKRQDRFK